MPLDPQKPVSKSKSHSSVVGQWGEKLVSEWLQQQGWKILARGWTSRWGELDIVALHNNLYARDACLAFVEVKTRSQGNWDADGLFAITLSKQAKLWKTARVFLMQHPHLDHIPCRFDVALVNVVRAVRTQAMDKSMDGAVDGTGASQGASDSASFPVVALGKPVSLEGYRLTLHTYLESAFELVD